MNPMNSIQITTKAANPPTAWLAVASVMGGNAAAASHGNFEVLPAVFCLIFAIFGLFAFNLTHRYYDNKHNYGENNDDKLGTTDELGNPIGYVLREGIKVTSIIALTAGIAILALAGWWTLGIAAVMAAIVFICNKNFHPFSRNPLYFLITFLVFGPIGVIGTELVQSERYSDTLFNWWDIEPALFMSVIMGCMAANCHILFSLRHIEQDKKNSKKTFATLFGKKGVIALTVFNTVAYITAGVMAPIKVNTDTWIYYMPIPAISLLISIYVIIRMAKGEYKGTLWWSIFNMVFYSVSAFIMLMLIGFPHYTGDTLIWFGH